MRWIRYEVERDVELMRVGWRPKFRPGWRFMVRRPWGDER